MKTPLLSALVFCLCFCAASAEQKQLIDYESIPALGEYTKKETALAKRLNTVIKRWNISKSNQALSASNRLELNKAIMAYNNALSECKDRKDEGAYYECRRGRVEWGAYSVLEILAKHPKRKIVDPFPTAKTSQVCKRILDKKPFLHEFNDRIVTNDEYVRNSSTWGMHVAWGKAEVPRYFYKLLPIDANKSKFRREMQSALSARHRDSHRSPIIYAWNSLGEERLFAFEDIIYLDLVSLNGNIHYIFSLDEEENFFDQACKIEREVIGYKNDEEICKQVAQGEYKKIASAPLSAILDDEQLNRFNADFNTTEKRYSEYLDFEDKGYFLDYKNEGKKHILLDLGYTQEGRCSHSFLGVYKQDEWHKIYIVSEGANYFFPGLSSYCDISSKEEIISIGKKNYILVSGEAGLIGLQEIIASDNASDTIDSICSFTPIYKYE
ncbi:MAG: hypothetical protein LBO72_07835 [Helicobacteraceae bacterium]|nr:hypothetical protein [Helicobacteraceae bacterium]